MEKKCNSQTPQIQNLAAGCDSALATPPSATPQRHWAGVRGFSFTSNIDGITDTLMIIALLIYTSTTMSGKSVTSIVFFVATSTTVTPCMRKCPFERAISFNCVS